MSAVETRRIGSPSLLQARARKFRVLAVLIGDRRIRLLPGSSLRRSHRRPQPLLQRLHGSRSVRRMVGIRTCAARAAPLLPDPRLGGDLLAHRLGRLVRLLLRGRKHDPRAARPLGRPASRRASARDRRDRRGDALADLLPHRDPRRVGYLRGDVRPRCGIRLARARRRGLSRFARHAQPTDPQHRHARPARLGRARILAGPSAFDRPHRARRGRPHHREPDLQLSGDRGRVRGRPVGGPRVGGGCRTHDPRERARSSSASIVACSSSAERRFRSTRRARGACCSPTSVRSS